MDRAIKLFSTEAKGRIRHQKDGLLGGLLRAGQTASQKTSSGATETFSSYQNLYGPLVEIPGHNLTVLGKEILNVNVTYFALKTDPDTKEKTLEPLT